MLAKAMDIIRNKQNTNLAIYGIGQLFNLVTPILVVPYIVSVCGVENFGKTSIAMALSFFAMVFIDYGSDIIGVKEAAVNREDPNRLEQTFITTFSAKAVLLLLVTVVMAVVFLTVPYFESEQTLFFFGLPILLGQCINPTWFLQGIENFKWITILTIVSKLIYLFGIFCCIHQKSDYVLINLWWGVGTILANGMAFYYLLKTRRFSFANTRKSEVIQLLRGNFSMFFSQIFVSLQMYAPIMLIGFFGNNLMAGQYKIIDQIIVIFKTYIYLFFNFVYPRVCFLLEKSIHQAMHFWKAYNGANFIFIVLSMAGIYCFSDEAVSYFTKTHVATIGDLLKLAVLLPLALSISIPLKQLLLGFNKQQLYIRTTMIMVVCNLFLMVLLLPYFGILGILLTLLATEIATIAVYYYHLRPLIATAAAHKNDVPNV